MGRNKKHKFKGSSVSSGSKPKTGNHSSSTTPAVANSSIAASPQNSTAPKTNSSAPTLNPLQPEQMSLDAYRHIRACLQAKQAEYLQKEDVTAVVQLAQHLRVFGLLSAVGYVRHARDGKIRERIRPMWTPLLWSLIFGDPQSLPPDDKQARQELMNAVYTLSTKDPKGYMVKWRQALKLSNHWNFWARACQEEDTDEQRTEDGDTAS